MADQLRAATIDDAAFIADVLTAGRPDDPIDPVMLRHEWNSGPWNWRSERFVIVRGGHEIGASGMSHPDWSKVKERFAGVFADFLPEVRSANEVARALEPMESLARDSGATVAVASTRAHDAVRTDALARRGYREDRRGKRWELDLVRNRERLLAMTEESRARMRQEGVRLLTLASDPDPERYRKAWEMSEEAGQDVPSTLPRIPEPLEDFMSWLHTPGMHEDRVWIARDGDAVLGLSVLEYPPVRGIVSTSWTATARAARGRGVARALKCETVAQAIALGVDRVRTGNDAKNDPILHINESMGYRLVAERIDFHKDL